MTKPKRGKAKKERSWQRVKSTSRSARSKNDSRCSLNTKWANLSGSMNEILRLNSLLIKAHAMGDRWLMKDQHWWLIDASREEITSGLLKGQSEVVVEQQIEGNKHDEERENQIAKQHSSDVSCPKANSSMTTNVSKMFPCYSKRYVLSSLVVLLLWLPVPSASIGTNTVRLWRRFSSVEPKPRDPCRSNDGNGKRRRRGPMLASHEGLIPD